MAPSLLALPPEIRIRIYGYALYRDVDIALIPYDIGRHAIHDGDFESMAFAATSPDSHLISYQDYPAWPSGRSPAENTALVRTCRLIHEEAIPFMYVGRKFVYYHVNTTNHHPPYYTARSFPKKNLQFVQDLLIIVDPGCINGVTPTEVDSRIADLVAHGCGARHLMLKFDLWFNEPITGDRKRLVSDLAHQTMALQSIASLPRLQDIKVRISEYRGIDLDEVYGPLIAKIEATKDWVREDDNGAYHAHGWGCGCTWVLRRPVKQLSALIGSPVSQQEASEGWGIQGQVDRISPNSDIERPARFEKYYYKSLSSSTANSHSILATEQPIQRANINEIEEYLDHPSHFLDGGKSCLVPRVEDDVPALDC